MIGGILGLLSTGLPANHGHGGGVLGVVFGLAQLPRWFLSLAFGETFKSWSHYPKFVWLRVRRRHVRRVSESSHFSCSGVALLEQPDHSEAAYLSGVVTLHLSTFSCLYKRTVTVQAYTDEYLEASRKAVVGELAPSSTRELHKT